MLGTHPESTSVIHAGITIAREAHVMTTGAPIETAEGDEVQAEGEAGATDAAARIRAVEDVAEPGGSGHTS